MGTRIMKVGWLFLERCFRGEMPHVNSTNAPPDMKLVGIARIDNEKRQLEVLVESEYFTTVTGPHTPEARILFQHGPMRQEYRDVEPDLQIVKDVH